MVEEPAPETEPSRWVASDVLGVINVFERMLLAMEARLVQKMDDNSRLASERWAQHDVQLANNEKRVVERFERLERDLLAMESKLEAHLKDDEHDDIVAQARLKPITGSIAWFWRNWRDIVLLLIGIVALTTFLVDAFGHFATGTP